MNTVHVLNRVINGHVKIHVLYIEIGLTTQLL